MSYLSRIPRAEKPGIARGLHRRLSDRKGKGPPEPGLDSYINELDTVAVQLDMHVTGKTVADAARTALLVALDKADDEVDTCMRHINAWLDVESLRRTGIHASAARALRDAAFPEGLGPIDDPVLEQNIYCRAALTALQAPEYKSTLVAVNMPPGLIKAFEAALSTSEKCADELMRARGEKSTHVGLGRDAEAEWVNVMMRLRRYVESRVKRGDTEKELEGKQLLEPLLVALQKLRTEEAARATRRENATAESQAPSEAEAQGSSSSPA